MASSANALHVASPSPKGADHRARRGRVARLAGIDIYVHWTFVLLVAWLASSQLAQGKGLRAALATAGLLLAVFGCVVLHELGHALVGRRFGVCTLNITLYPIGGIARLDRIPERPSEELLVALAGPAVNLAIATVLAAGLALGGWTSEEFTNSLVSGRFLPQLLVFNITLAAFNLLPAFPMDGGRVLRAVLASRMNYAKATRYAATAGQALAVALGILGLFFNWMLLLIALFVFIGAEQEAQAVQTRSLVAGVPVREAMIRYFHSLPANAPLSAAVDELLAGEQKDFPVVEDGQLLGMLTREQLMKSLTAGKAEATVGEVMLRDCGAVEDGDMLDHAMHRMRELQCRSLPIVRSGALIGLLTLENIGEWLMLHSTRGRAGMI